MLAVVLSVSVKIAEFTYQPLGFHRFHQSQQYRPVSGISFPRNFACLLITKTYHSHLISHVLIYHFIHHHCHHPLLLLSSTPGWKLIFSTDPFLYSSSTFLPTRLTPQTPAVFFKFFSGMSVFNFGIVCWLSWLLVSLLSAH